MTAEEQQVASRAIQAYVLGLLTAHMDASRGVLKIHEIRLPKTPDSFEVELASGCVLRVSLGVIQPPKV